MTQPPLDRDRLIELIEHERDRFSEVADHLEAEPVTTAYAVFHRDAAKRMDAILNHARHQVAA